MARAERRKHNGKRFFTEFKKRYNDMKERGEKIISLLDGMRYENAIATLDWCKEKLDCAVIRSRDIFPDSADERAQAYLDEKVRQEGDQ